MTAGDLQQDAKALVQHAQTDMVNKWAHSHEEENFVNEFCEEYSWGVYGAYAEFTQSHEKNCEILVEKITTSFQRIRDRQASEVDTPVVKEVVVDIGNEMINIIEANSHLLIQSCEEENDNEDIADIDRLLAGTGAARVTVRERKALEEERARLKNSES